MSSEHDEQVALFNILRMYEDKYPELKWVFAIPNGGHRHISVARKMKAEGVKAGVLDVCVPFPVDEWAGAYLEMKIKPNRLTENQRAFIKAIEGTHKVYVCFSALDACHAVGEYLGIDELTEIE